jgi:hypothetical protein
VKLVLDTNALVSGLLWGGPPNRLLRWARDGLLQVLCCEEILVELRRVLAYPRMRRRLEMLDTSEAAAIAYLMNTLTHVPSPPALPVAVDADPSDNLFLGLAVDAGARLLVSGDQHLLALGQFEGIPIVTPGEAIEVIDRLAGLSP